MPDTWHWGTGEGLLGMDDPAEVDAALGRGERSVGAAVIGLALNWPPEVAGALSADGRRLLQSSGRDSYDHGFGTETLGEAITRYRMLGLTDLGRSPLPFLKMRFTNTRTRGRSTNHGRGLADPQRLVTELRAIEGGAGSFVEFENRRGHVWRVEWHGTWYLAEWDTASGTPREIGIDELIEFAVARLHD